MDTAFAAAKIRVSKAKVTVVKGDRITIKVKNAGKEDQSQGIRSKNCFGKGDQKEDPDYREKAGKDKYYVDGISYEKVCGQSSRYTGRRGRG